MIMDTEFKMVGVIDTFISLIWTDRYDEAGDFELLIPMDTPVLDLIKEDYYLMTDESEHVMIIEDMTITTDVEEGKRLKITGSSLETILSRRIVWNKTVFKKTYKGDTTEVDTVPLLQDAIKQLLNENLISPAMASRKLENFVFDESTDKAITKLTIEAQYRGESIYDIVSTLCKENQIGFKVTTRSSDANIFDKSRAYSSGIANETECKGVAFTVLRREEVKRIFKPSTYYTISYEAEVTYVPDPSEYKLNPAGSSNWIGFGLYSYSGYGGEFGLLVPNITEPVTVGTKYQVNRTFKTPSKIDDLNANYYMIGYARNYVSLTDSSIKVSGGVTFRNIQIVEKDPKYGAYFVFKLYSGADRTYDQIENPYVVFSPDNDNLFNSSYYRAKSAFKNVALVSGDDSEDETKADYRQPVQVGNAIGIDRREIFVDGSDISITVDDNTTLTPTQYAAHQKQRGIDTLIDHLEYEAFEGEVEATIMYKYGEDFFMGDYVQLEDEYGHQGKAYISEFIMSQDASGISMYPTFITLKEGDYDTYE